MNTDHRLNRNSSSRRARAAVAALLVIGIASAGWAAKTTCANVAPHSPAAVVPHPHVPMPQYLPARGFYRDIYR